MSDATNQQPDIVSAAINGTSGGTLSAVQVTALIGTINGKLDGIVGSVNRTEKDLEETRKDLNAMRTDVTTVKEQMIELRTKDQMRTQAAAEIAAVKAEAKSDMKDNRQGIASWVMWIGIIMSALLGAAMTAWLTNAHH